MGGAGTGSPAGARLISVPDLTGLAAVVMVLLFFIMVSWTYRPGNPGRVQLALAAGPGRSLPRAPYTDVRVSARRTSDRDFRVDSIFVLQHRDDAEMRRPSDERHMFEANELGRALDAIPAGEPINLFVDGRLPVGAALRVLEGLGDRGHRRVFLVVHKRDG